MDKHTRDPGYRFLSPEELAAKRQRQEQLVARNTPEAQAIGMALKYGIAADRVDLQVEHFRDQRLADLFKRMLELASNVANIEKARTRTDERARLAVSL